MKKAKTNRTVWIICFIGILSTIFAISPEWVRNKLNPNSISVNTNGAIDLKNVTISWEYDSNSAVVLYENKTDINKTYGICVDKRTVTNCYRRNIYN